MRLLVVYNICGIRNKDNAHYYLPAIQSLLDQEFPNTIVAISGCAIKDRTKHRIVTPLANKCCFNWIDTVLPLGVTFNHTVRQCHAHYGNFDATLYVDSGVSCKNDPTLFHRLLARYQTGKYAMVAAPVDSDQGYKEWSLKVPQAEDFLIPVGRAVNLHCQLFGHELYQAFGQRLLPDVFASDTSESIFTFLCAALGKKWLLAGGIPLQHRTGLDGPSAGFRHRHPLLFRSNWNIDQICAKGYPLGFGYEECRPVLKHDPACYDEDENHKDPERLKDFLREHLFIDEAFYRGIQSRFQPMRHLKSGPSILPSPKISCLLVSHEKPQYVNDAINSVLAQTLQDWELLIMDSGSLLQAGHFSWLNDPRIKLMASDEDDGLRKRVAMAPWCYNQMLGKCKADIVCYLCDDDLYYPNAFETLVNFFESNREAQACYASQDMVTIRPDGSSFHAGERRALVARGPMADGPRMDCQVDYLQFCHRREIINLLPGRPVFWPENKNTQSHADGVFMDRIGDLVPILPIDIKISQNRRTPISTYAPSH